MSQKDDVELLRAIAHARMYVTSGRGLESVIHALAHSGLSVVAQLLMPALERMQEGETAETAVKSVLDRTEDVHLRSFIAALIASGKPGIMRLDELSMSLHTEREARAEVYGARLTGILDMTAALFVFSFAPTIIRVLGRVPPNAIIPQINPPVWFEYVFYAILALLLTGLLGMSRVKS